MTQIFKFLLTGCCIALLLHDVSAQRDPPRKPPGDDDVVRVRTDLVQAGVRVFDKNGHFVDGLRRDQFELKVDGKPREIAFFEAPSARAVPGASGKAAGEAPEVATQPEGGGRTIIFFIDDLHLSLDSLGRTRSTLSKFIDRDMHEGDLVAIASTSGRIGFLQQFTDDKTVLRAAAARLVFQPYNVRDMTRQGAPMTEYMALTIERRDDPRVLRFYVDECLRAAPPRYPPASCEVEVVNRARQILMQASGVISATYDSLKSLMHSSSQLPGRKLVFFISDGFLLDTGPRSADPRYKLNEIIDAALRGDIVIYTIDARGLISGLLDATNNVPFDPNGKLENALLRDLPASQDALNALAVDTGGRALRNQNSFDSWIEKILEETSRYYLLAWRPDDETGASQFRNISISVTGHSDYEVRLPRGFITRQQSRKESDTKVEINSAPTELREALGAFFPKSQVRIALSNAYLDTPANGVVLTASMQVSDSGLEFASVDGAQIADVDVAGVVLTDKGKQAGSFQTRLRIRASELSSDVFDTIYNYRTPLKPGLYQVRVAARDVRSGHLGSAVRWIEIPDLNNHRLSISSILIGVEELASGDAAAGPQVQFSVDHRLRRDSDLRFICFVYNASNDVSIQARILLAGKPIVLTPVARLALPKDDPGRVPYSGKVPLNSLSPGRYVLEVVVTDGASGGTAVQQTPITIIR